MILDKTLDTSYSLNCLIHKMGTKTHMDPSIAVRLLGSKEKVKAKGFYKHESISIYLYISIYKYIKYVYL